MRRHTLMIPAALLAAPLLTACGGSDDGPEVVASAYPFAFVAERVAGDRYTVENLTQPGGEPHDLELTPRQVGDVQDATLVVYTEHFQTAVDEAVEQADRAEDATVELGGVVGLLEASEDEEEHDHAEEEDHEGEEHSEEEGHDHGGVDPHFWLDPQRMILAADAVAEALSEIDPDHAADYEANAAELTEELQALHEEYVTGLETCERRSIVTSHAAFAYLADAYDLTQIPIAGLDPSAEPTSEQLAEITDLVTSQGITTVFTEELVAPDKAEQVAHETGATVATLDPIEGLSDETSDEDYLSLMRANLEAIRQADGCQ
ncbi:MAG: metal ABC transporter substrate-binding protein [Aeromicrobium sp.]|uniref:metal ABC transporter substrate-binding protein n=1 Tax=Aeromicrobium sp. TaxID=1871063 RepID=UPI0039E3C94D